MTVTRLASAQTGPVLTFEKKNLDAMPKIDQCELREDTTPYCAWMDLNDRRLRLAPVDTNRSPEVFDNVNRGFLTLWVQAMMTAIDQERMEAVPEQRPFPQVRTVNT